MFNHTLILCTIAASMLCTTSVHMEERATLHSDRESEQEEGREQSVPCDSSHHNAVSSPYMLSPLLITILNVCTQNTERTNERIQDNKEHIQTLLNDYYHQENTAQYFMLNPGIKKVCNLLKDAVEKQKALMPHHLVLCFTHLTKTLQHHIIERSDTIREAITEKIDALYGDSSEQMVEIAEHFFTALTSERKHKRLAHILFFINNVRNTMPLESQHRFIQSITSDSTIGQTLQEGFLHPDLYPVIRSLPGITTLFPQLEKTNKLPALFKPYTHILTNPELSLLVLTTIHEQLAPLFHEKEIAFLNDIVTTLSEPPYPAHHE